MPVEALKKTNLVTDNRTNIRTFPEAVKHLKAEIMRATFKPLACVLLLPFLTGCAALFGWDIHAPGILSPQFAREIVEVDKRVALYLPPQLTSYRSTDKGGRFADPQTYHVGEAYTPMLIEGFQSAFREFVFVETEPTPELMKQYGIHYLVVVGIKSFGNRVTLKGQALGLNTETVVYDPNLNPVLYFESTGSSDQQKVFAKKGGPEVNLNAALERNIIALLQYLQDSMTAGRLSGGPA